jgi:DNA repair exonuclease SbcCD nuclease subunit
LDSPLRGLAQYEDAPVKTIRNATRRAFENLVDLAIAEQVAFVLIAGDLWDGDWPDAGPGLFFIKQAMRLREAEIPVYVIKGNHDAANTLTRELRFPSNVHMFDHVKPETRVLDDYGVAIHGQSFRDAQVTEDLSAGYPTPLPGCFNIGMLHTCLEGDARHYAYAPANINALVDKGYDYWALGHIHRRSVLVRNGVPIVYPGNLQGRDAQETGPKGCELVTVEDSGRLSSSFEELDAVRWLDEAIDISEIFERQMLDRAVEAKLELLRQTHAGRLLALRLHLSGTMRISGYGADLAALRERVLSIAVGVGDIWLERLIMDAQPPQQARADMPLTDEIAELIERLSKDDGLAREWMDRLRPLRAQLTGDLEILESAAPLYDLQGFRASLERSARLCFAGKEHETE